MLQTKLSRLMKLVIGECSRIAADEALPVEVLVDLHIQNTNSDLSVAKASVSRTLRRLWSRGLVELYDLDESGDMISLTEASRYSRDELALIESNPVEFFKRENAELGHLEKWRSAKQMLEEYRRLYGGTYPRWFRARYVSLVGH